MCISVDVGGELPEMCSLFTFLQGPINLIKMHLRTILMCFLSVPCTDKHFGETLQLETLLQNKLVNDNCALLG